MDFIKTPIISFQTSISKILLDNMQNGIVEGITKAEGALTKIKEIEESGISGASPTITVTQDTDNTYINIQNPDGTFSDVSIPNGKDGTSATIQVEEIEGGHRLIIRDASGMTEVDVMDGEDGTSAEQLVGSTSDITPTEVFEAMAAGTHVSINHTDLTYGNFIFDSFAYYEQASAIIASFIIDLTDQVGCYYLVGNMSTDTWDSGISMLAKAGDIPEIPSSVDFSNYENGTIVETYSDGSTKTYTFEFDSDGNPTKITDSNGNETVLTW